MLYAAGNPDEASGGLAESVGNDDPRLAAPEEIRDEGASESPGRIVPGSSYVDVPSAASRWETGTAADDQPTRR